MTANEIAELEKQLDSEIQFPNTWLPPRVNVFNAKLSLAIYQKLNEMQEAEGDSSGRPNPKDFRIDGKFDRAAFNKALNEWKGTNNDN